VRRREREGEREKERERRREREGERKGKRDGKHYNVMEKKNKNVYEIRTEVHVKGKYN